MGKTRTKTKSSPRNKDKDVLHANSAPIKSKPAAKPPSVLLTESVTFLAEGQPDRAIRPAKDAITRLETISTEDVDEIDNVPLSSAYCLLGAIHLELGDVQSSRNAYLKAATLDPTGSIVSADAFLNLAQLSEEGGRQSIDFFERAVTILRHEIATLEGSGASGNTLGLDDEELALVLEEKKEALSDTLCAMAEVFMTDLSWEDDAEQKCENYVTEALVVYPESIGALQTLASVRISQERAEEARSALKRSMDLWWSETTDTADENKGSYPEGHDLDKTPEFASRISLVRLLLEVEMREEALAVCERLVREDDQSVEAWYLGGWGRVLKAQTPLDSKSPMQSPTTADSASEEAREWLVNALRLYKRVEYEDERLKEHALELVAALNRELGIEGEGLDDAWEDEEEEEEEEEAEDDLDDIVSLTNGEVDEDVDMT